MLKGKQYVRLQYMAMNGLFAQCFVLVRKSSKLSVFCHFCGSKTQFL